VGEEIDRLTCGKKDIKLSTIEKVANALGKKIIVEIN